MRVCLFWNRTAGGGASLDEITDAIKKAGHQVERVISRPDELSPVHMRGIDCVAAAGGDGTVARVARRLVGGDIPLAIIPLGTANNIATSLSIKGVLSEVVARWEQRGIVHLDVGSIDRRRIFFEGLGSGLVAACIEEGDRTLSKDDPGDHLVAARQMYLNQLDGHEPRRYSITLDDETVEGEYLLVEVLNTSQIGPGVELATNVTSVDGLLSVVALTEDDRRPFADYIAALRDGRSPEPPFHSWRSRRVEIRGAERLHVDDMVIPATSLPLEIELKPRSLPILA